MSEVLEGYIEKVVFHNQENGYSVLNLIQEGSEDEITCVGTFSFLAEGECIRAIGNYTKHAVYGQQFLAESYEVKEPEDIVSMERYLASGAIKGIGNALSSRIIKKFGLDTFRIIEDEPEKLADIKGISLKLAKDIYEQFTEKRDMRGAMLFLQQYGITGVLAVKIFQKYGNQLYDIIKVNPYRMAEDIERVGFKIADEIASRVGIQSNSDFRIRAGILYVLLKASTNGHVFLPRPVLERMAKELLSIDPELFDQQLTALQLEHKIIMKEVNGECQIYNAISYYMELNTARMLLDMNIRYQIADEEIEKRLRIMEQELGFDLDEMQRIAVLEAAKNGLLILTGGPGTGKTTTINAMIQFFEAEGMDVLLAAPTGRAAKRICETTGHEARTIHRMLEISKNIEEQDSKMLFERNEGNPLETDVLIIDELSMVDIGLIHALLKAVVVGTRLVLVGDENQLPSVGPGNVLHDIVACKRFPVVKLTKIFRQAFESDIIVNAHKINKGEKISLDNKSKDFFFLQREEVNKIYGVVISLVRDKLPKYVNAKPFDIQVLTPMRKGELGVERLNQVLQQYLNPPSQEKTEHELSRCIFRVGDKVMQIKNNYQLAWELRSQNGVAVDSGMGVFNGDSGVIRDINNYAESVTVEYDEGRFAEYPFSQLEELELAYAITIHKSQGSEYPAVVLPILSGPRLLFHRNLLYTAVTRAKNCVTIVGSLGMLQDMIENESEQRRYSGLADRIVEMQP